MCSKMGGKYPACVKKKVKKKIKHVKKKNPHKATSVLSVR